MRPRRRLGTLAEKKALIRGEGAPVSICDDEPDSIFLLQFRRLVRGALGH